MSESKITLKGAGGAVGLLLLLVALVAANIILKNVRVRHDLTEEQLYTLSDGTRNLLRNLDRKIALKLFVSDSAQVPIFIKRYGKQVEDLLEEYRIASNGKITVTKFNPRPDSDAEDLAKSYGIAGSQVDLFGPAVYCGLAAVAGETEGVIPALDPRTESLLEYNLSRLIYRLAHPEKPVIGVLSSLPVLGSQPMPQFGGMPPQQPEQAWLSFQDIRRDFTLEEISPDVETIPSNLKALIVFHPKNLPAKTLYAIDQFVLGGGHLLAFVDPFSIVDLRNGGAQQPFGRPNIASGLDPLLSAWGIGFNPQQVVADMKAVTMLSAGNGGADENPVFLTLRRANGHINAEDIATGQLDVLMLPFAGALEDNTDDTISVTPLVSSSDLSSKIATFTAQMGGQAIRREFRPDGVQHHMALRLTGTFKTAYPDGPPAEEQEAEGDSREAQPGPALPEGQSAVIIVADTDLLFDQFCVEELNFFGQAAHRPRNDNLNFFANVVEMIAGSSDLISVRSRGKFSRPFERVMALEEKARQEWQEQEKTLNEKLQETRRQLSELQRQKSSNQRTILSPEQQNAIKRFQAEEVETNRKLKQVRKKLRQDIERLGVTVKVANTVLMPVLIAIGGLVFGLWRRRRM